MGIFEALTIRAGANRVRYVLGKTYMLDVVHPQQVREIKLLVKGCASFRNEHELAVLWLARFVRTIKPDHPMARREVEKYIRMAKGAYARGLVTTHQPLDELFDSALVAHGIDEADIDAA